MATATQHGKPTPGGDGPRRIVIEPVTRVEGHGKVTILMDEDRHVKQARLHIVEFRGFERFAQGRFYWEMPVVVQRLCGICPVSHHLCASKACDKIVGVDQPTQPAEKLRRLMHYGQTFQSHALHFFHLASPDLLFGFGSPVDERNVIGVIRAHPEVAKKAVLMRKWGQEIIKATAGKKIHGTGSIPGGMNKCLSPDERDMIARDASTMLEWAREGLALCKQITLEHADELLRFGSFESNFLSIVSPEGGLDLYDGNLRAIDAGGGIIFDQVAPDDYLDYIREGVRNWSYMKFPYIRSLGQEKGWYRVGPLARVNTCDFIDTPLAEAERQEFKALGEGRPVHATMAYHWARMIETVHAAEKIGELLKDPDLLSENLMSCGNRRRRGVAIIEAPRGTLIHHYEVNDRDQVTLANLIVSTTHNNEAMNQAVRMVADQHLDGRSEIDEGVLNHVEVGIRAYDPCLSCATHALGQMRLEVEMIGPDGEVLDVRRRG